MASHRILLEIRGEEVARVKGDIKREGDIWPGGEQRREEGEMEREWEREKKGEKQREEERQRKANREGGDGGKDGGKQMKEEEVSREGRGG